MYSPLLQKHRLGAEHLCALEVLADAGLWGCTLGTLIAYGFPIGMVANLIRDGFATARRETLTTGHRKIRAARVRITDAGRRAIEEAVRFTSGHPMPS
jgi:hypothetical protein